MGWMDGWMDVKVIFKIDTSSFNSNYNLYYSNFVTVNVNVVYYPKRKHSILLALTSVNRQLKILFKTNEGI